VSYSKIIFWERKLFLEPTELLQVLSPQEITYLLACANSDGDLIVFLAMVQC
jgi:hypothetical protein